MIALGMDGCRSGWVAAWISSNGRSGFDVVRHIGAIDRPELAMIDIPIGLPDSGYRAVDRAARGLLGKACSRVFLGARRPLLATRDDYARANAWAKADGKGVSRQLFGILPKIAEVDEFITVAQQGTFRECHPELVFQRLNGAPLPRKTTPEGFRLRRDLIADNGFGDIDTWLGEVRGTGARADDLLDACACALAARETLRAGGRKVACADETDARGLRMEMWY